jgi:transposase
MALRVRPLTAAEAAELRQRAASRTLPAWAVERARMVWGVHAGETVPAVARRLGVHPDSVRAWVKRFNAEGLDGLADRPRAGRPAAYGPDVVGEVLAAALTKPDALGLPFACWTLDRLAAYLNEAKGIPIKRSRIDELLVAEGLRWRTQETWFGERARAPGAPGPPPAAEPGRRGPRPPTDRDRARVDPQFAEKRGPSSASTRRRLRVVS